MAPIHHHFEKKGWAEFTIVIWILDNSYYFGPGRISDIKTKVEDASKSKA